jgi:hypothetical protein
MSNTRRLPDSRGLALTDKTTDLQGERLVHNDIRGLGAPLLAAVTAIAVIVVAIIFCAKADLSCTRRAKKVQ